MKMVVAYIHPFMAEKVIKALQEIPEVPGASLVEVRGFGRGRGKREKEGIVTEMAQFGTLRKIRVETIIPDNTVDLVFHTIRDAAYTGSPGDGKIYVMPVERAVRIRTGELGDAGI
jgi:nitrogen regulatory protein PII